MSNNKHAVNKRRHIAVKLTDEELGQLRVLAVVTRSSSVDLATTAIRELLRKNHKQVRHMVALYGGEKLDPRP